MRNMRWQQGGHGQLSQNDRTVYFEW